MSMMMPMITLSDDVRIRAAGGPAMILNPTNMEVLDNDVVSDEWVELSTGAQIMLVGAFNKTDTWLCVVSETGDFSDSAQTFGLVVRRTSWDKLTRAGVVS
ncbi:MAG: hypothetical protein ACW96N_07825 [Candidatus Thorarchaeota archaeon]|jgi:hypothetical protein